MIIGCTAFVKRLNRSAVVPIFLRRFIFSREHVVSADLETLRSVVPHVNAVQPGDAVVPKFSWRLYRTGNSNGYVRVLNAFVLAVTGF